MMNLTESAGGFLSKVLDEAQASPDTAVRLAVEGDGVQSTLDTVRPGDTTYNHEGRKVLLLDTRASRVLADRTLDVQPTEEGPRLSIV